MSYIEKRFRCLMTTVFEVNMPCSLVGSDSGVDEKRTLMW